jgi:hypothetical protein
MTSATAPFSTCGPSGKSEKELKPDVEHWPELPFWKNQYEPLSCVQKLLAHGCKNPVVGETASSGGLLASPSLNSWPNCAIW